MELQYEEIDWELTPLGRLSLHRYQSPEGEQGYELRIGDAFLMATHGAHGEVVMAGLAHGRLQKPHSKLAVLVGGLGAGHTLKAVLKLPGIARVVVAEIGRKVVEWNRRYFAEENDHALEDRRVTVQVADLAEVLARNPGAFNLLLLDVDNGPGWLAAGANAGLYESRGLMACREALRPGGVLAIWSPGRNPGFLKNLLEVFPGAEERESTAFSRAAGGPTDVVYLAQLPL